MLRRAAAAALCGALAAARPGPLPAEGAPRIKIHNEHIDLGVVRGTEPVHAEFNVVNAGDAPLEITKLETTCGCIAALMTTPTLAPGAVGEIVATLDPTRVGDRRTKVIAVFSNDPARPVVHLKLSADVEDGIELSDAVINFGRVPMGEPRERTLIVFHPADAPLTLTGIRAESGLLSFSWHHKTNGDRPAFVITARLSAGALPGPFADTLQLTFEQAAAPRIEVPVRAQILGPVIANPTVLGLGLTRAGATAERTVSVTAPSLPAFRIERVESSSAYLIPALSVDEPGRYRVAVQVGPETPQGPLNAVLRVYTNARPQPLVEIPVAAIVR